MRVVRAEEKQKEKVKAAERPFTELVDAVVRGEQLADLTEKELGFLVDYGYAELKEAKEITDSAKSHKAAGDAVAGFLLVHAEEHKWKELRGRSGMAVVRTSTKREIDPSAFHRWLTKNGKEKLFGSLFSVLIGQVEKYLGSEVIEKVGKVETEEYGSVRLEGLK